jgi:hypothetical protein
VALAVLVACAHAQTPAAAPDLHTPEMQKLRAACAAKEQEFAKQRHESLLKLIDEYVQRKYGAQGGAVYGRVSAVGREVGIPFAFDRIARQVVERPYPPCQIPGLDDGADLSPDPFYV